MRARRQAEPAAAARAGSPRRARRPGNRRASAAPMGGGWPMRGPLGAALLLLAGCGFQLRGGMELPPEWLSMHLHSPSPNGELAAAVRGALAREGVEWLPPGAANYTLQLGDERFARRNLSIGANARVAEFELALGSTMRVLDRRGRELAPPAELAVTRITTHDPENPSGKQEEAGLLRREMRAELARRVLRRIRFLAAP